MWHADCAKPGYSYLYERLFFRWVLTMYVKVRVRVGAKNEKVTKVKDKGFHIEVREKAEQNLANTRVREIIAQEYNVAIGKIRIIYGHHSPSKIISVDS